MEIYQLKTFAKVAEVGNITRAAEMLFTSQPAVSAHIKALEGEFGVRLFNRSSKGMSLTDAGTNLLQDAKRIINDSNAIFTKAIALRNEVSGSLRIGLNNGADVLHSGTILTNLAKRFPDLGFDIFHGDTGDILEGLDSGVLDLGFYEGTRCLDSVESETVGEIDLCIAVPEVRYEALKGPDWKALAAQTWIYSSPKCSYLDLLNQLEKQHGMAVARTILINDDSMFLYFVANDCAVSIAPRAKIETMTQPSGVKIWPHFSYQMPLSIAYAKSRALDPAIVAFVEETKRVWDNVQAG